MAGLPTSYLKALAKLAESRALSVESCARIGSIVGTLDRPAATPALCAVVDEVRRNIAASWRTIGTPQASKREIVCFPSSADDGIREAAMGLYSRLVARVT
jgi:hypothetical protein